MLKSSGPSMEPCRTPKLISEHKLYVPFTFTLCFHLVQHECNRFKEGYLQQKPEF